MYIYLSKKFTFDGEILEIEVARIASHRDIKFETVKKENFQKFYDSICSDNKLDFSIVNNEVVCDHYVRNIELPSISMISTLPKEECNVIRNSSSLYDLLIELANRRC